MNGRLRQRFLRPLAVLSEAPGIVARDRATDGSIDGTGIGRKIFGKKLPIV
jgi:hypothetical protein